MSRLLPQPEDWTEPGAHPVVPGVHRVPLPLPMEGLTTVNAYVLEGRDGLVLIDPGWASPETERAMAAALRQLGHRISDIRLCLATHHHWDHYTQAYQWRDELGSRLLLGWEERHSIESYFASTSRFPNHAEWLVRCGAGELAERIRELDFQSEREADMPYGLPDGWLYDGDTIELAEGTLHAVYTPGHTRGHVVFRHADAGVLFSGDHILPHITPSLGFEWAPEKRPLRSFLRSLKLTLAQPDALLLPAHGPVTESSHRRAAELLDHHRERLDVVLNELRAGARTAYDVARAMPWTRKGRRLEELATEHQMSAVVEVDAHLDVLTLLGRVKVDDREPTRRYLPVSA